MTAGPAFLGIDLGTSAVKVLALARDGRVLAKAARPYPTRAPETNWAEQSPGDWWEAAADAAAEVVPQAGAAIAGVGLSGQLNGFVLADEGGTPLHDAVIWLDLRAQAETAALLAALELRITALTGNPLSPICVLPKLAWMARHRPDLVARAERLFLVKDWLLWRLTGAHATDPSDASATALLDLAAGSWSEPLMAAAGIEARHLPAIRPSAALAGRVTAEAARRTGIPEGTPVVVGAGDVAALSVGCGVIGDGVVGVTLGTAGHVVLSAAGPPGGAPGALWQIAHAEPGRVIWLGLVMSGGLSLAWLRGVLTALAPARDGFDDVAALAGPVPPGARGLTFLPFLEGASTPWHRPAARAAFVGLTSSHGAAEMVQAVMEGVACNVRECVELFEAAGGRVDEVRLAEGGSRIARWCQIVADVLDRPVSLLAETDTSALGAAILARAGVEGRPLAEVAQEAVRIARRFAPDPARVAAQDEAFRRYRAVAEAEMRRLDGTPAG